VTIQKSIRRFKEIEAMATDGRYEMLPKKEVIKLERERKHLHSNLVGIKDMPGLPDVLFVVDSNKEQIAVREARKLGIPVVAVVDTNCDPSEVDFVIPGNDDALRAIRLFTSRIADSCLEGRQMAEAAGQPIALPPEPPAEDIDQAEWAAQYDAERKFADYDEAEPGRTPEEVETPLTDGIGEPERKRPEPADQQTAARAAEPDR
jgi:small subunit ribosomal protein S2